MTLALGQKVTAFRPAAGSDGIEGSGVTVVTEKGEYTADVAILGAGFRRTPRCSRISCVC